MEGTIHTAITYSNAAMTLHTMEGKTVADATSLLIR